MARKPMKTKIPWKQMNQKSGGTTEQDREKQVAEHVFQKEKR